MSLNGAICISLDPENPSRANSPSPRRELDKLKGAIFDKGLDFVLGSLEPLAALIWGELHDLRDRLGLPKVLLLRFERMLHHRLKSELQGIIIWQEIVDLIRLDMVNAS